MTLNDLEQRNSPYLAFFSPKSITLEAHYATVVEDKPILSVKYCLSVPFFHFRPKLQCTLQRGFTAIAGLLWMFMNIYTVSQKNIPDVFSYNSQKHCRIFIIFGRNITEKVSNQMCYIFLSYLINGSSLPCETKKIVNCIF